jgi:hypothetical protein
MNTLTTKSARKQIKTTRNALASGGCLLRGVRTFNDRKRPSAKRMRQTFHCDRNRGFND